MPGQDKQELLRRHVEVLDDGSGIIFNYDSAYHLEEKELKSYIQELERKTSSSKMLNMLTFWTMFLLGGLVYVLLDDIYSDIFWVGLSTISALIYIKGRRNFSNNYPSATRLDSPEAREKARLRLAVTYAREPLAAALFITILLGGSVMLLYDFITTFHIYNLIVPAVIYPIGSLFVKALLYRIDFHRRFGRAPQMSDIAVI